MQNVKHKTLQTFKSLSDFDNIAHFYTSRQGGVSVGNYADFNISPFTGDEPHHQQHNLTILSELIGFRTDRLVIPFQNHGDKIVSIDASYFSLEPVHQQQMLHGVDALVTNTSNICIGITTADCVPLLFYDPKQKVIAAVHAGWRGTCAKIASKTILYLQTHFQSNPADICVAIGPSISKSAYHVGGELFTIFSDAGFPVEDILEQENGAFYLDLWKANVWQLTEVGVSERNIEVSGVCTYEGHERFFSARRLGIKSGRMLSAIMLK